MRSVADGIEEVDPCKQHCATKFLEGEEKFDASNLGALSSSVGSERVLAAEGNGGEVRVGRPLLVPLTPSRVGDKVVKEERRVMVLRLMISHPCSTED